MSFITVFLIILLVTSASAVSAELALVQYDPLVFQLTFSEPVQNMSFQLLFNNIYNITYVFQTNVEYGSEYRMLADTSGIQKTTNLQTYNLLFTNPIDVAGGYLDLDCYSLQAKKSDIVIQFPSALGIILVFTGYTFNTFTEIGKLLIEFIHIYVLYMFQSRMTTTISAEIYTGMLMIPPSKILVNWNNYEGYIMACLILPIIIIFLLGAIGLIYKKRSVGQKSILGNILYEELVFNIFIKSTRVFLFNLFYNSIMFIQITKDPAIVLSESYQKAGYFLIYFNLLTCVALLYLKIYILNPNLTKQKANRQKYLKGKEFSSFKILHQRVHMKPWFKRNYSLLQSVKILFLVGIFFCDSLIQYFAVILEFLHIFFLFTVRPLHQEFYLNTKVVCRLFLFTQYLLIVLGNLYFSLGEVTFNFLAASKFIVARDTIYLIFQFVLIIVIFFQIYFKCSNLTYQIKVVKEANAYKVELVQKNKQEIDTNNRKHTAHSDKYSKSEEKRIPSFSEFTNSPPKPVRDSNLHNKGSSAQRAVRGKSKSKLQLQMMDMTELGHEIQKQIRRERSDSVPKGESEKVIKKRHKWRQQSLLQGIVNPKK